MTTVSDTPQLPAQGEIFLDHVGWFVGDMAHCSAQMMRLGFPLTPYSVHGDRDPASGEIVPTGTANRLAMLRAGYLEFLVRVDGIDSPAARHLDACLAQYEGVHLVAFSVNDAKNESARLASDGFTMMPTVNLRRRIELEDGSHGEVAFTVVRPELGSLPEGRIQSLTHHTPGKMWQERYIAGGNGIDELEYVLFVSEAPETGAQRMARYTGRAAKMLDDVPGDAHEIRLDRGRLYFMTPDAATAFLGGHAPRAGVTIAAIGFTGDPVASARMATEAGIDPYTLTDGRTLIAAEDALGCALVIAKSG